MNSLCYCYVNIVGFPVEPVYRGKRSTKSFRGLERHPPARNPSKWAAWESPIPVPRPVPQNYAYARALEPFKSVAQQPCMWNPYIGTDAI